jgi:geranylgeranyl pyrophosphate synthase
LENNTFFEPIQEQLAQVEERMHAQAREAHPNVQAAIQHLISAGGKRIRPALGLLVGNMLGGQSESLVTLGAAVELLHTATLVHDDLIDGALLRRGIPTLNARWSPAATVLTGDFLFARAAELATETGHLNLMHLFAETLAIIVNGELTQFFAERGAIKREDYYRRIYAKTAALFEMTCQAAAIISEAHTDVRESMRAFGRDLGMAFQIVDDVLDFSGEQRTLGKPVGSDLLQGLITLPAIYYAEAHPDDPDVLCLTGNHFYTEHERMERLVESVRRSHAIQSALAEAHQYIQQALARLEPMPAGPYRAALENLAAYIVQRHI